MKWIDIVNYFVALFMICNPFGILPAFLRLTATDETKDRKKTSLIATLVVIAILIFSTWVGIPILRILGIQLAAFQFAGGLVILLLAFSMLNAEQSKIKQTSEEHVEGVIKESVAITPLAIPLIAGPGAISTVIVEVSKYDNFIDQVYLTFVAVAVAITLGVILLFASYLENILGRVGLNIFTRIGGLIVASIALNSLASSLTALFPILAGG